MRVTQPNINARPRLLPVLILALAIVIILRAGDFWIGVSGAMAQPKSGSASDVRVAVGEANDDGARAPTASRGELSLDAPVTSEAHERLLTGLADRRAALDVREAELETREALLRTAEAAIDAKISELKEIELRLDAAQAAAQADETADLVGLAKAYERMRARDAAQIFNLLEDEILVPVAAGMRTQAIASVLAEMEPEKARALTRKLARKSGPQRKAQATVAQ